MKSFFTIVLIAIFFSHAAAALPGSVPACHPIENWGSSIHSCSKCREGYHFVSLGGICDIGFECCKGLCCSDSNNWAIQGKGMKECDYIPHRQICLFNHHLWCLNISKMHRFRVILKRWENQEFCMSFLTALSHHQLKKGLEKKLQEACYLNSLPAELLNAGNKSISVRHREYQPGLFHLFS